MVFVGLGFEIPLWCILSPVLAVLAYWYGTSTHGTFEKMGVPYRKPLPFIGNMMNIFKKLVPEEIPGRISGSFQGRTPILDVADVDFIKEITIKQFPMFADRRDVFAFDSSKIMTYRLFVLKGDHWKHVRSLLSPSFTSGKLKQMYPVINTCADKFVAHLKKANSAPVTVKDYAAGYTMDVIASTAFGIDLDTQSTTNHPFIQIAGTFFGLPKKVTWYNKYRAAAITTLQLTVPQTMMKFLNRLFSLSFFDHESVKYFNDIVDRIVTDRKGDSANNERKNFITICTENMVDLADVDPSSIRISYKGAQWSTQGLTMDEVSTNATSFFSAGYETTATALQFFFYNMSVYPDIQEKLYESISEVSDNGILSYDQLQKLEYLDWCVSESLRMFPPILRFDRVAKEAVTICGISIPKGQIVNCLPYAVHHNPIYWENPEEFDPERFSPERKTAIHQYAYLPFGAGSRGCIAMRMALLELKVAIVKSLTAFKFEKTAETQDPESFQFKKFAGFILQPDQPIKVSAVPRR